MTTRQTIAEQIRRKFIEAVERIEGDAEAYWTKYRMLQVSNAIALLTDENNLTAMTTWEEIFKVIPDHELGESEEYSHKQGVTDLVGGIAKIIIDNIGHTWLTKKEEIEICDKVEKISRELSGLLKLYPYLFPPDVRPIDEYIAIERICCGLISSDTTLRFSDDVEKKCDESIQDLCQEAGFERIMTTSDAYRVLRGYIPDATMSRRLEMLAESAKEERNFIVSNNGKAVRPSTAEFTSLALSLCKIFDDYTGAPRVNLVTGLLSAIYDSSINSERVSKVWQRRDQSPDYSDDDFDSLSDNSL